MSKDVVVARADKNTTTLNIIFRSQTNGISELQCFYKAKDAHMASRPSYVKLKPSVVHMEQQCTPHKRYRPVLLLSCRGIDTVLRRLSLTKLSSLGNGVLQTFKASIPSAY